jgi:transposase
MARVEVITGRKRRRRWSAEQKRAIVAESLMPRAVVAEIARRAEICPNQIYRWRREIGVGNGFAQVLIAPVGDGAGCPAAPAIEIEFAGKPACASRLRSRPGWRRPWSKRCRGDDPGPFRGARLAGSRPHRHAAWDEQPGAASPRSIEARSACRRFVRLPREKREPSDIVHPSGQIPGSRRVLSS